MRAIQSTDWTGQKNCVRRLGRFAARLIALAEKTEDVSFGARVMGRWADINAMKRACIEDWSGFHSDLHGVWHEGYESVSND